ncbi:DUF2059 domain-containing protein [Antarcticimicrobium sediminis]|uniref:DUF2059 domain-containing protein n=1 Tax=Antarcticimicrobium sediminis TaxID=2546227 RepID=A0A4R5EJF4_9RHOB|nr:DUF2059 domain-containing protein [Antarcticimicrobium sediminis]TDE34522.1 DUF2059 domain-containing protein [Antarcticimicrobium sediminis]
MALLRRAGACLSLLVMFFASGLWAGPDATDAADLARLLRVDDLAEALHHEGGDHGTALDQDMLDGRGGAHWARQVAGIYGTDRIATAMRRALAKLLAPDDVAACAAFFDSPLGQKILSHEIAARVAMRNDAIEAAARDVYDSLKGGDDPRLAAVMRFADVNDLIERNVAGALSSSFQFRRGLVEGGVLDLDEAGLLAEVWSEEGETRQETEKWLYGYLLMAYQPLSLPEMERYIGFSQGPAGQALNAALFDGFDGLYRQISYELGLGIANAMMASDI